MRRPFLLLVFVGLALGCADRNGGDGHAGDDGGPSSDEQAQFDVAAPGAVALVELAALANGFFQLDPTLDPSQSGATLTASFGPAAGCKLGSATSGQVSVTVGKKTTPGRCRRTEIADEGCARFRPQVQL